MTQNCVQALDQFILDRLVEDQTRRAGGPKRVRTDWTEKLSTLLKCRPKASFERLEAIGDGSYSKVYHVSDKVTNEDFALKKLHFTQGELQITVLREIRNLVHCQHPNIIALKEVVQSTSSGQFSLVLEFCAMDLHTLYEASDITQQPQYRKEILRHMLCALDYLEKNRILHRDVKLSNFLVSASGELKLADFGLSRYIPLQNTTADGSESLEPPLSPVVVTLWYRAPEVILADPNYSFAVDMWSFGCLVAELLIRKVLFKGQSDLDMLGRIFGLLGTPTDEIWPGFSLLPVCEKFSWVEKDFPGLASLFIIRDGDKDDQEEKDNESDSKADKEQEVEKAKEVKKVEITKEEFDLLQKCLCYYPKDRIRPETALNHPYFTRDPEPKALDVKDARKQVKEWEEKRREEKEAKGNFLFFKRAGDSEGTSSIAMRLAQYLNEREKRFDLFAGEEDGEEGMSRKRKREDSADEGEEEEEENYSPRRNQLFPSERIDLLDSEEDPWNSCEDCQTDYVEFRNTII